MFNGQFRLYENLMYVKKFAKVQFCPESTMADLLLCNKKIVGHYNYVVVVVGISYDFQCVNFQLSKHQISSEKSTSVNQSQ